MSRCFPYPPPGYLRQGLVESIKLEREKVLPKTEQKLHKKRENEEKKKGKKGKVKSQVSTKKLKKLDDVLNGYKDDQLEKSDLTEEHGPAVCYSSDGTQNSHKRKKETVSSSECKVDGNKIKIRFSFKKPRVSDASINEEPVCSSSGRVEEQICTIAPVPGQKPRHDDERKETIALVPEPKLLHDNGRKHRVPSSSRSDKKMLKAALQYKTLFEDWMPPPLQLVHNDDDDNGDGWLVSTKKLVKPVAERTDDNDVACRVSATSYRRAHFIPEAEIYALPYTIPF